METGTPSSSLFIRIRAVSFSHPLNVSMTLISTFSMLHSIEYLVITIIYQQCFSAVNDMYMNELTSIINILVNGCTVYYCEFGFNLL